jgi:RNA polymerase sigma factor (sigma-70 family)
MQMLSVHTLMQEARLPATERRRMGRKEERRALAEAIGRLPELPRLVLSLRYCEGLRPRQIAAVVGLAEEEVRRQLSEAALEVLRGLELSVVSAGPAARPRQGSRGV